MRSIRTHKSGLKWLEELASPRNRVEIDFHGTPAFYVAHPGWDTRTQRFGQHLLYHVVHGAIRAELGKREEVLKPGDLLWISPGAPFRCWLADGKQASFYRFRLDVQDGRKRVLGDGRKSIVVHGIESARPWIEEIVRTGHQDRGQFRSWRLRGALLGLFADVLAPGSNEAVVGKLSAPQKETLVGWMNQHGAEEVTPSRLAALLKLSPDYFARIFQRTFAISPRAWIVRERIKMAAVRLLESQLNIGEVAEEFGYNDIFFFSRQFKQVMGRSPKQYRREA